MKTRAQDKTSPPVDFPIPFALSDGGRMVAPTEATGPVSCPCCKRVLVVRRRDLLDVPAFLHPGLSECEEALEQSLILRARQVLVESKQLRLPLWERASSDYQDRRGKLHFFTHRIEERLFDYDLAQSGVKFPGMRADAQLRQNSERASSTQLDSLVIEIQGVRGDNVFKTNLRALHEMRITSIDIDVSRATSEDFAPEAFVDFVLYRAPRGWLYHERAEEAFERRHGEMMDRYNAGMTAPEDDPA
jgi:hypothetical protein